MYYDQLQLQSDLALIVRTFGERRALGFFSQGLYEKNGVTIVDNYLVPPNLWFNGDLINLTTLITASFLGWQIMTLAIDAEECMLYV